jgi:signal transduction histidine kinase
VFAPLLLGSLVILELMQIPLAWSLAHRIRSAQRQRVALLQQALDASDDERRRIARDLHDGIVQDLIGVSYSVGAVLQDPGVAGSTHASSTLSKVMDGTQRSIRGLRTLLVDIYPPSLQEGDLPGALGDLVAPYGSKGIDVSVDFDVTGSIDKDTEALVYRTVRESMKNVAKHAHAHVVQVRVSNLGSDQVELTVTDDGDGFDPAVLRDRPAEGHVGLQLLSDLARTAGGTIDITSAPGRGTTIRLRAPR